MDFTNLTHHSEGTGAVVTASLVGNLAEFGEIRDLLSPLNQAIFVEASPAPIKYALHLLGLCKDEVRLPLTKSTYLAQEAIKGAFNHAKINFSTT